MPRNFFSKECIPLFIATIFECHSVKDVKYLPVSFGFKSRLKILVFVHISRSFLWLARMRS